MNDDLKMDLLHATLQLAVPLEIEQLRGTDPELLLDMAREQDLDHADDMLFGGPKANATATSFAAHVRVLAALALTAWGGVTVDGMHWCARPGCRGRDEADHPHPLLSRPDHPTLWRATTQTRPVTTVPLPESEAA